MSKSTSGRGIASIVTELCAPVAIECGLSVWDVAYEKEGSAWFLRIYIEKAEGIGTEDCEKFTRLFNPILDEADPIEGTYYLEVSSPGIERRLRTAEHFASSLGKNVQIKTIRPVEGRRDFTGNLLNFEQGQLTLQTDSGELNFKLTETAYVKLVSC